MKYKMNSCDEAVRNERDVQALTKLCAALCGRLTAGRRLELIKEFNALCARRAAEDAGERQV